MKQEFNIDKVITNILATIYRAEEAGKPLTLKNINYIAYSTSLCSPFDLAYALMFLLKKSNMVVDSWEMPYIHCFRINEDHRENAHRIINNLYVN